MATSYSPQFHIYRARRLWPSFPNNGTRLCVAAPKRRESQGTCIDPASCRSDGNWERQDTGKQQPDHRLCRQCDRIWLRCQDLQQWCVQRLL